MTAPTPVQGFKSKDGQIWDTVDDAMRADICFMIMQYAEDNYPDHVESLFRAKEAISNMFEKKLAPPDVIQHLAGKMIQSEVDVIAYWIFKNMELLESLIAYYIEARTEITRQKVEEK